MLVLRCSLEDISVQTMEEHMYSASVAAEAMRKALAGKGAARVPEERRLAEKADPRNLRIQVIYDDSTSLLTEPQRYLLLAKLMPWATATLSRLLKVRNLLPVQLKFSGNAGSTSQCE